MKRYLAGRRSRNRSDPKKSRLLSELRQLQALVKNNVTLDLMSLKASVWLVCPDGVASAKNTFAKAKVIVLKGVVHAVGPAET